MVPSRTPGTLPLLPGLDAPPPPMNRPLAFLLLAPTALLAQDRVKVSFPIHDLVSANSLACKHVFPLSLQQGKETVEPAKRKEI